MEVRNITIIQLDGPTELIASAACINGLRKIYPEAALSLVIPQKMLELAAFIDAQIIIPINDNPDQSPNLPIDTSNQTDILINLSLSERSCIVGDLFQTKNRIGAQLGENKEICLDDGWTRLYRAFTNNPSEPNDLHLIEILTAISGAQWSDPDHSLLINPESQLSAKQYLKPEEHIKVAINISNIPDETITCLIETLHQNEFKVHFYFLGTLKDRATANRIAEKLLPQKDCYTNLAGKASLSEMVSLHQLCDIAIGGPGLCALAASGFGTLNISYIDSKTENFHCVPYGLGHLIIRPESENASENIGFLIAEIIAHAICNNNGVVPSPKEWQAFFDTKIEAYISKITVHLTALQTVNSEKGARSEISLVPMLFSGVSATDLMRKINRLVWNQILHEVESIHINGDMLKNDSLESLSTLLPSLEALSKACSFGIRYTNSIRDAITQGNLSEAQKLSDKLPGVDELISSLGQADERISTITNYFFINQEQIFDIDPLAVSEKMLLCYTLLSHQAMFVLSLYHKLLNDTFDETKTRKIISEVETNG